MYIKRNIEWIETSLDEMRSQLGKRYRDATFDTFDSSRDKQAYDKCLAYANGGFKDERRNGLLIAGNYGTGKTHLATAIAYRLIENNQHVKFGTYTDLLENIKGEFGDKNPQELHSLKTVSVLILDDIGKEKQSEWTRATMFDVVNARYDNMLPTVFTTNLTARGLEDYLGGAVYSRICETCTGVQMTAKDKRKEGLK